MNKKINKNFLYHQPTYTASSTPSKTPKRSSFFLQSKSMRLQKREFLCKVISIKGKDHRKRSSSGLVFCLCGEGAEEKDEIFEREKEKDGRVDPGKWQMVYCDFIRTQNSNGTKNQGLFQTFSPKINHFLIIIILLLLEGK